MTTAEVRQRAEARVGHILRDKWRLDSLIGVGGMASVYAATHRNGKRGAVKLLHPEMCLVQEAKNRFLREGYVANKVEHPGAVSVLDDDVAEDGSVFLVMELLEGESIQQKLKQEPGRRLPAHVAVPLIIDMLDVLAVAHQAGVIHRDLKPDNVFVTTSGQVKLLDFGIARLREAASQQTGTQAGSLLGTPSFMPPEQALGDSQIVDQRTDIWAVGATFFAMLAGRAVHVGESQQKILLSAMTQQAPPLLSIAPDVSPRLAAIIDRALAFDQSRRWASAGEMRDALRAVVAMGLPSPAASYPGRPLGPEPWTQQQGPLHGVPTPFGTLQKAAVVNTAPAAPQSGGSKLWLLAAVVLTISAGLVIVTLRYSPRAPPGAAASQAATPTTSAAPESAPSAAASAQTASSEPANATPEAPLSASAATATSGSAAVDVNALPPVDATSPTATLPTTAKPLPRQPNATPPRVKRPDPLFDGSRR